ncbi:MAG TPA: hypothetical protein VEP91_12035 [Solirubrobacterales bacterium]|nr:hypothetical protein [Solirubrobacterales bacterium]
MYVPIGVAAIGALLAFLVPKAASLLADHGPRVRLVTASLSNGWSGEEEYKSNLGVELLNEGDRRALITSIETKVMKMAKLRPCIMLGGSGYVAPTRYDIVLPPDPGFRRLRPLSQEIQTDDVDRIRLMFNTPTLESLPAIYELELDVHYDGETQPIDLGRVLVMTPVTFPHASWDVWLARRPQARRFAAEELNLSYKPIRCFRHNRRVVAAFLPSEASRTQAMNSMLHFAAKSF